VYLCTYLNKALVQFLSAADSTPVHAELVKQMQKAQKLQKESPGVETLTVKKDAENRLARGHPWIYANDVVEALPGYTPYVCFVSEWG
jgi:hypothetical protein